MQWAVLKCRSPASRLPAMFTTSLGCKFADTRIFLTSVCSKRFTQHSHIHHTFTHQRRSQPCKATANSTEAVRERCLPQGHLDTQLGGRAGWYTGSKMWAVGYKKKNNGSVIWSYFGFRIQDEQQNSKKKGGNTTNLLSHLQQNQRLLYEDWPKVRSRRMSLSRSKACCKLH